MLWQLVKYFAWARELAFLFLIFFAIYVCGWIIFFGTTLEDADIEQPRELLLPWNKLKFKAEAHDNNESILIYFHHLDLKGHLFFVPQGDSDSFFKEASTLQNLFPSYKQTRAAFVEPKN